MSFLEASPAGRMTPGY